LFRLLRRQNIHQPRGRFSARLGGDRITQIGISIIAAKTTITRARSRFCESENATIINRVATNPDRITKPLASKPAHENRFGENAI
jgi:hypothetical protein